ncbi:MAG: nuclear transport factor 2 family protein [Maribacter sp.]
MKTHGYASFILIIGFLVTSHALKAQEEDRATILAMGKAIRDAFGAGNIDLIKSYHHPEVSKAISYEDYILGRNAVIDGLGKTLNSYCLEFVEYTNEDIYIEGNLAIEQSLFSIRGTPKTDGNPFIFKGRTMVIYQRYDKSPSGWATVREIIQPNTN